MEFHANEGKKVEIEVNGEVYLRHAIKTRFVKQGDSYIDLFIRVRLLFRYRPVYNFLPY